MNHWFSGWKLWPDSPKGPVDGAYRQTAWLRPYRPGAPRILLSVAGVLVFMLPMYSAIIILLTPGVPLVPRLLVVASLALIAFGIGILVARFFASGVYVNDNGLRLVTLRGMQSLSWREVADISSAQARTPIMGLPFARAPGELVVVTMRDTGPVRTTMTSTGLDFVGRPEAYDAAALAVERWWRDAGGEARDRDGS